MIYIGIDDTDVLASRGTGHLARKIAGILAADQKLHGVTRHQLLLDPRVPCTKNNSSSAILVDGAGEADLPGLAERVRALMMADFQPGSDPGLCIALDPPAEITEYGRRTQREIVAQSECRELAQANGIALLGLGGDEGGVIGALAAVGLAASGDDGRYVLVGQLRELAGLQPVSALLAAGIAAVQTSGGQSVRSGLVQTDRLRPARRGGRPVAVVEWATDCWRPLKLD
jgi:tRNA(Ile2) C34 agmatinyltransferase TiaS